MFVGKIYPCFVLTSSNAVEGLCKFTYREGWFCLTVLGDFAVTPHCLAFPIWKMSMRR